MEKVRKILGILNNSGFEAYLVGGCVRDFIMGKAAHDIDITTNALPEQIMSVFSAYTVIPTGLKHGTVTVLAEGIPYEITTYRVDGNYSDNRRPDKVTFTPNLREDLARRDFTMNAIAMDINSNMIDPFGGVGDIKNSVIRCVGEPDKRFKEDSLRIMRAIRFAAQLGFDIEQDTANYVKKNKKSLEFVSRERIRDELDKLICGEFADKILLGYGDVISEIIPEITPCIGFDQRSDFHIYDVWAHTVRALAAAPADNLRLRRSLLFHDIAKPDCYTTDELGKRHFKGHAQMSALMSKKIMKRLRYSKKEIIETSLLIDLHREKIHNKIEAKHILSKIGEELFYELIKLKECDNLAKRKFVLKENETLDKMAEYAKQTCASGACLKIHQLALSGSDVSELGLSGKEIGDALDELLKLVIDEELPNEREALIEYIKSR